MRKEIVLSAILVATPGEAATKDEYKDQFESLTCDAIDSAVRSVRDEFSDYLNKKDDLTKQYIALAELRIDKRCLSTSNKYFFSTRNRRAEP